MVQLHELNLANHAVNDRQHCEPAGGHRAIRHAWRAEVNASQVRQVSRAAFSRLTSGYEDFDKTAQTITKLGGEVALPKFAVPGLCWQGYFRDTESNVFGIFQVDEQAK